MSDRFLEDLRPEFRARVDPWLADCKADGIDLLITCTRRTLEEQAALYAIGRTLPGHIVTKTQPGHSAHNFDLALDVVVMVHGNPDWLGASPLWQTAGDLAAKHGIDWLGKPDSAFHELAHFQHPDWRHLAGLA